MRQSAVPKPVVWIGTARRDLRDFPEDIQDKVGTALQKVQYGSRPTSVKTLSGFGSAGVLELKVSAAGDAYRAVYTVRFPEYIVVLHVFQKKSHHGIQTSKQDMEKIQDRLKIAETYFREMTAQQNQER